MARNLQTLAVRDRTYLQLFEQAAANAAEAAAALHALLSNYPDDAELADRIRECEHIGDKITHEVIDHLNQNAPTAADRADVISLTSALDDIVDFVDEVAEYLGLYKIEAPMEQSIRLSEVLQAASAELAKAVTQIRNPKTVAIHKAEVHRLENDGDRITREAVASLFDGGIDPMVVICWKDLFERLEAAIDATEHAVNIVEGISVTRS